MEQSPEEIIDEVTDKLSYVVKTIEDIRKAERARLRKAVERMKIYDKGKIVVEFGDGTKHETFIDTDRAVFHNNALQSVLSLLNK